MRGCDRRIAFACCLTLAACAPHHHAPKTLKLEALERDRPGLQAVVRSVVAWLPLDSITVCIEVAVPPDLNRASPDHAFLTAVAEGSRNVVGRDECPRTYQTMIAYVDSLGRPQGPGAQPGHRDPHVIDVLLDTIDAAGIVQTKVDVWRGTSGTSLICKRKRVASGQWIAECGVTGHLAS